MESQRKRQKLDTTAQFDGPAEQRETSIMEPPQAPETARMTQANTEKTSLAQALKETEVGITEFINADLLGFSGIFKKRYTDFLVNEILPSGEVVHLRNLKPPKKPSRPQQSSHGEQDMANGEQSSSGAAKNRNAVESSAPPGVEAPEVKATQRDNKEIEAQAPIQSDFTDKDVDTKDDPNAHPENAKDEDEGQVESAKSKFDPSAEDETLLASYLGRQVTAEVIELHRRIIRSPQAKPRDLGNVLSAVITDRELRTKIHEALRRIFSSRLDSFTNSDGAMDISAAPPKSKQGNSWNSRSNGGRGRAPTQPQAKSSWKDLGGDYLHFSIYKENKDTMEVISYLARTLKLNPKNFQFAGTKDRRAVTVQRASVYRVPADRLVGAGNTLRNATVGDYEYHPQTLSLGDSSGNEFVITLRQCALADGDSNIDRIRTAVSSSINSFRQKGFLNYYGLQRFGTFSTRTDTIGLHMLRGHFEAACNAILQYEPEDLSDNQDPGVAKDRTFQDAQARADAIKMFQTTDQARNAIHKLPRKFSAEANIMQHLSHGTNQADYLGALQMIPRNLRLMYVHAYQSLVWNFAASQRWKLYGDAVVEGDLVMVGKQGREAEEADEVDADGEVVVHPSEDDNARKSVDTFPQARPLTAGEAAGGNYTVFDIVLPLPGYDIVYPKNEMTDYYKSFMASEEGGGLDPFDMRRKWKDTNLSGGYRKLVGRGGNDCSAEVKSYMHDDEQFVQTDLDLLNGRMKEGPAKEAVEGESSKTAVIMKFQLGSSQYATVALREFMKGGATAYKYDFGAGR